MYINKSVDKVIEDNMMEYAQYVIKNRALPCVYSGVKPIHLKILWSMLENKEINFTKSATVWGEVMKYSPHGSCYETMVNMIQKDRHAYNLLLGQGNFGSFDSNELQYASDRYTECKLSPLALDCLEGLKHNMVDMIPNYDNTKVMPKYLPVKFPLILCMANNGMAVGMANDMPSFNLIDVCNATIKELKGESYEDLIPDFANGGYIINNKNEISKINNTGLGKVTLRAKYEVEGNTINIKQIPYNKKVFVETIIDKIIELVKLGKLKEISNIHDTTGLKGIGIAIEFKKGTNVDNLINKLFNMTQLETTFSCNMNVLVGKDPKVLGVRNIIKEWCNFRKECVKRGLEFDLDKLSKEVHLLMGLKSLLLDIDEAVNIIRKSKNIDEDLMNKFKIDKNQCDYINNIKLKNINEKYINKQLEDIESKEKQLQELNSLNNDEGIIYLCIKGLEETIDKFGKERLTKIIELDDIDSDKLSKEDLIEDYNCRIAYTSTYIKKHQKKSDSHNVKEGETILGDIETTNKSTLLIFTNKANRYKIPCYELETYVPSKLGDYVYNILPLDKDEKIIKVVSIKEPKGFIYTVYENGCVGKVDIKSFLSNNKRLQNCYNIESKLLDIYYSEKDIDIFMLSSEGKGIVINTEKINSKASRNTKGVRGIKLPEGFTCIGCIMDVNKDYNIRIIVSNGKSKEIMLDDVVSEDDDRRMFDYLHIRVGNSGNFLYNTRRDDSRITSLEII